MNVCFILCYRWYGKLFLRIPKAILTKVFQVHSFTIAHLHNTTIQFSFLYFFCLMRIDLNVVVFLQTFCVDTPFQNENSGKRITLCFAFKDSCLCMPSKNNNADRQRLYDRKGCFHSLISHLHSFVPISNKRISQHSFITYILNVIYTTHITSENVYPR